MDREHFTSLSQAVADLIAYTERDDRIGFQLRQIFLRQRHHRWKNPRLGRRRRPSSKKIGGTPDMFGKSYGRPAGSPGADVYGNSRPFQTEPPSPPIIGPDYFNAPSDNVVYNRGPIMNLIDSPSFPSGHTTYGYMGSLVLAVLVPDRYQQMIARAAEYGNDRILMGAHYAMDVMGGRTLATYDLAHLLANDPAYVGRSLRKLPVISDYQAALKAARADVVAALQSACGNTIEVCAREDTGRFSDPALNEAFYAATQTYGLPVVYPKNAGTPEDVGKLAPEAGYLLTDGLPVVDAGAGRPNPDGNRRPRRRLSRRRIRLRRVFPPQPLCRGGQSETACRRQMIFLAEERAPFPSGAVTCCQWAG